MLWNMKKIHSAEEQELRLEVRRLTRELGKAAEAQSRQGRMIELLFEIARHAVWEPAIGRKGLDELIETLEFEFPSEYEKHISQEE